MLAVAHFWQLCKFRFFADRTIASPRLGVAPLSLSRSLCRVPPSSHHRVEVNQGRFIDRLGLLSDGRCNFADIRVGRISTLPLCVEFVIPTLLQLLNDKEAIERAPMVSGES